MKNDNVKEINVNVSVNVNERLLRGACEILAM